MNNVSRKVIAVVGAGGKTTLIHRLSAEAHANGQRVLIVTTTHMAREADTDISCDPDHITNMLSARGSCMAGSAVDAEIPKIGPLPDDVYKQVRVHADLILCEADGSRHLRVKWPAQNEPVIPADATEAIVVMGVDHIGRPIRSVVHRHTLMMDAMGISDDEPLTKAMIDHIAREVYPARFGTLPYTVLYTRSTEDGLVFYDTEGHERYEQQT